MTPTLRRTYQYKLYQCKQLSYLHDRVNISGLIWNHCIALHRRYYRWYGKSLSKLVLQKHITQLKKQARFAHWKLVPSQAIQDITDRIELAYTRFFKDLKAGRKTSPPKFRALSHYKSFTLKQAGWSLDGNRLRVGKRSFKLFYSRELKGTVKTVTLKRNALGEFFAFFSVIETAPEWTFTSGKSVGLDFGLKQFLKTSEGQVFHSPEFFKTGLKALQQADRTLSRKAKGSANRRKARQHKTRLHKRFANQRRDFFFKLAKALTQAYDYISIEDLNLKGMHKLWGRKISDLAFAEFVHILKSQGVKYHCIVTEIDRFYPSSKTCHKCGYLNQTLALTDRNWTCPDCRTVHCRDQNAAINIDLEGQRVRALTRAGDKTAIQPVSAE